MYFRNSITPLISLLGLSLFLTFPATAKAEIASRASQPKKIIIMIGDGMGPAYTSAYRYYKDDPNTENIETTIFDRLLVGMSSTYPAKESGYITDSAASATALATGEKSYNGAISVDTNKKPIKTIMEIAKARGMAIGVAVTSQVNHATPAAFLTHNESRRNYKEIAQTYLTTDADVILGGGQRYFSDELLTQFKHKGYQHITKLDQLESIKKPPVLGLFADVQLEWEKDQATQKLSQLTTKSLALLNQNEQGFVLLVEGSLIDWAGHSNDVTTAMAEVEEFANAMAIVEQFVKDNSDALMLVTADHNTGGLSVAANGKYIWRPEIIRKITGSPNTLSKMVLNNNIWQKELESALSFQLTDKEKTLLESIKTRKLQPLQKTTENNKKTDAKTPAELKAEHLARINSDLKSNLRSIIDLRSNTGWTSSGHTGVDVQIFAAGAKKELFSGHLDNTEIAKKLIKQLQNH